MTADNSAPKPRLLFCPAWYPNRFNEASGSFNRTLAKQLGAHFDVTVLYVHVFRGADEKNPVDLTETDGLRELSLYVRRRIPFRAGFPVIYIKNFMKAYARLFPDSAPDLVFVRGILPAGLAVHQLRSKYRIPYVTIDSFSGLADQLKWPTKRWWVRGILKSASLNAGVSTFQADVLRGHFPRLKIDVMTNVIAESPAHNLAPGNAGEKMRVLYVGNFVPVKGWDILLEAFRRYIDSGATNVSLTLVGPGQGEEPNATIGKLGLGDAVQYLGPRPNEEVRRLMSAHHFLVLPSRVDTCPNVVLESFMEGRPVLATRSGGAVDLVNDTTGLLVDRESPDALRDGLAWMRSNYERFDPETIRRYVIANHSVDSLVRYLKQALPGGNERNSPRSG